MSKVRVLTVTIPKRLGLPLEASKRASKALEMLYDYDAKSVGTEFQRTGNSMEDCENRMDVGFAIIDGVVARYGGEGKYGGNVEAAKEGKKLLLLASTPDKNAHAEILVEYGDSNEVFSDVMTVDEAIEVGEAGFWNDPGVI